MRLDRGQIEAIDDVSAEILKKKTPAERLKMAFDMWDYFHDFLSSYLTSIHAEWTSEQIQKEILRRLMYNYESK